MKGFEHFLACNPEWLGRVVFILTVVPSREEVDQYQKMKQDIDGLVGRINGSFGNTQWTPVLYQYRSLGFNSLVALYSVSDAEEKDFSVAWHYRNADPELAAQRASELMDTLVHFTANLDLQVLEGKKVIEARCAGVNKGTAAAALRAVLSPDLTIAVGDDSTDEDLFRALPPDADTIRVGMKSSYAQFNLRDYTEVRWLLEDLAIEGSPRIVAEAGFRKKRRQNRPGMRHLRARLRASGPAPAARPCCRTKWEIRLSRQNACRWAPFGRNPRVPEINSLIK